MYIGQSNKALWYTTRIFLWVSETVARARHLKLGELGSSSSCHISRLTMGKSHKSLHQFKSLQLCSLSYKEELKIPNLEFFYEITYETKRTKILTYSL